MSAVEIAKGIHKEIRQGLEDRNKGHFVNINIQPEELAQLCEAVVEAKEVTQFYHDKCSEPAAAGDWFCADGAEKCTAWLDKHAGEK